MQVSPGDLDYLATNGYVTSMQKDAYDRAVADVATLTQRTMDLQREQMEEAAAAASLQRDVGKTHSIMFHFEGRDQKAADLAAVENERVALSKEMSDVVQKDSEIKQLILTKSTIDRMVPYDGGYLALTGLGVVTLNNLNIRNYRVSDAEFSDFIAESNETMAELKSIAQIGRSDVAALQQTFPEADPSQLWSVSIGLAKLQGDQNQINRRFGISLGILQHFKSTSDNKMMAAEIMTSLTANPLYGDNSDLPGLGKVLENLDHDLRHHAHVPNQLSAGVAALLLFGRRHDGTFPTDRFVEFTKMTRSYESAAIMSVLTTPTDQLESKFLAYRQMFGFWGYQMSEDTELASAFLTISDFVPTDITTKMSIILSALKTYLEYPLVATAILTSIPTFEANETLDLMEKTYSLLWSYAQGLQRSELISLSVRMIHGIKNELVKQLDPTAKIANTPVQFTHAPTPIFFLYHGPLIIAHSSYYSTFSGIGGAHPAHVHGYGGGFGG
ncbi:MAG TPA: hypothetical protein VFV92_14300 [Candidatus Bathyarchaeia archaeon]|nr:hypothetical protein [Candidatus Bathyarchaeia archaeon]